MSVGKFVAGFAVGAAIGAIAGILLAPQSGEETREMLGDMADDIAKKTDANEKTEKSSYCVKADDIVSDVQEKSEEIMSKLQDMLGKKDDKAEA